MIGDISLAEHIYIVCGYTDMRKAIDGLAAIVQHNFSNMGGMLLGGYYLSSFSANFDSALVDTAVRPPEPAKHMLIGKLTDSGMSYAGIEGLVDSSDGADNKSGNVSDNGSDDDEFVVQTSFFGDNSYKD